MREDLTEDEMCGPMYFEFFIKKPSPQDGQKLMEVIERIHGVKSIINSTEPTRGNIATYTVTVSASSQYFDAIHRQVITRAYTFQASGI